MKKLTVDELLAKNKHIDEKAFREQQAKLAELDKLRPRKGSQNYKLALPYGGKRLVAQTEET